jgi:hypothetical protein
VLQGFLAKDGGGHDLVCSNHARRVTPNRFVNPWTPAWRCCQTRCRR